MTHSRRVQKRAWDFPVIHWHGTTDTLGYYGWLPCSSNYCLSTKKES